MRWKSLIPERLSTYALLLVVLFNVVRFANDGLPAKGIVSWDTYGYYLYLPQTVLHNDLGLENFETIEHTMDTYHTTGTFYQASKAPNGKWVMKYPMGMAILYAPAFGVGCLMAWMNGSPIDGFSPPFQYAMFFWSVLMMLFGLFITRRILITFCSELLTGIVLLLIALGTNYYQIHISSHASPHVFLFTGYALVVWFAMAWWRQGPSYRLALILGTTIGLMALARPSEILTAGIPLLYGMGTQRSFKAYLAHFKQHHKHYLTAIVCVLGIGFLQLLYWKTHAGEWIYNSYNNPGEGFEFSTPFFKEFLFSYRKGWFIYTPMALLSFIGIRALWKHGREWFWPVVLFYLAYIYLSASWSNWWYATSFSQRTMVQTYPLMAIMLAHLVKITWTKNLWRYGLLTLGFSLLLLNQFQTWQYHKGIIDASRMTKRYYWLVFGKTSIPDGANKYLLVQRSFTGAEKMQHPDEYALSGVFYVNREQQLAKEPSQDTITIPPGTNSRAINIPFHTITAKDHAWIRASARLVDTTESCPRSFVATFVHNDWGYKFMALPMNAHIQTSPGRLEFHHDYLTPEVRTKTDFYQFYFQNLDCADTLRLTNVQFKVYERLDEFY